MSEDLKQQEFEIRVRDEIREHVDVLVRHEWKWIDEELQLVDEQLVHVKWTSHFELMHAHRVVVGLIINHPMHHVFVDLLVNRVHIVKEAEFCHHFEVARESSRSVSLDTGQISFIHFVRKL